MTVLAFAAVIVPFAVILGRLALAPGQHLYLPDDLALIDLHTRWALQWKQQLGVFDHNGWNHPGPTYFYLLSVAYRVLGSGAKAMFVGATSINALAAVACVGVVRRRSTPGRALWAGVWVCLLGCLLAAVGPGSITYSEGALGGLVSPWNPMVVTFPLLLLVLLCAAAVDRSPLSLLGALLVGSFIVQTNVSAAVLVVALLVVAAVVSVVTLLTDRRHRSVPADASGPWTRVGWVVGSAALVLMWVPPVVQQLTNHPGNLTLIYRFFTAGHPGPSLVDSVRSVVAVYGVLLSGPSEVMSSYLGRAPDHGVAAYTSVVVAVLAGVVATAAGIRQRNRFASGLGALSLVGLVAMVVAVSHVVGVVYGYLVVWAVAVPVAALIGVGTVRLPVWTARPGVRVGACLVAVLASVVLVVRVASLPALSTVSDPEVGALASVVARSVPQGGTVFVNDGGAGATPALRLLDVEQFVGLVNQLDQRGYHPRVNHLWRAEFGPGFEATGTEDRSVELTTWTPSSPGQPGYRGRVGDLAVQVTSSVDGHSTDPADTPG
jgi:hypothetical protein